MWNKRNTFFVIKRMTVAVVSAVVLLAIPVIQTQAASHTGENGEGQHAEQPVTGVEITSPTMMYAVKKVNVRQEPSTSAEQIGQLEEGDRIFAVELTEEGWYRVALDGQTGYIRKDFLAVYTAAGEWNEPFGESIGGDGQMLEEQGGEAEEQELQNGAEEQSGQDEAVGGDESKPEQGEAAAGDKSQPNGQESSPDTKGEEKASSIPNLLIIGLVVVIILIYAAVQIMKERKGEGGEVKKEEDEFEGEKTQGKIGDRKSKGVGAGKREEEHELVILDLDAEMLNSSSKTEADKQKNAERRNKR